MKTETDGSHDPCGTPAYERNEITHRPRRQRYNPGSSDEEWNRKFEALVARERAETEAAEALLERVAVPDKFLEPGAQLRSCLGGLAGAPDA